MVLIGTMNFGVPLKVERMETWKDSKQIADYFSVFCTECDTEQFKLSLMNAIDSLVERISSRQAILSEENKKAIS